MGIKKFAGIRLVTVQPVLDGKLFCNIINRLIEKFKSVLGFLCAARHPKYFYTVFFGSSF